MEPVINPSAGVDRTLIYIIGVSLVLLFGITALMIGFVIRYRRSRHPIPADIRGHTGLELAWMLIPTAIALSMFYMGWDTYLGLRSVPANALDIQVAAEMFAWTFTYPNGKQTSTELVVPQGRPVKISLSSKDVIHSFYVPAFRIKMDAVKGLHTYLWFLPDHAGTFNILCAEYCGLGHSEMSADLKVVPPADFDAWLARKEPEPVQAKGEVNPEILKLFDLSTFHSVQDTMSFYWKVDGPHLHCKLRAPALGWVAAGFNPTRGMQGADFILAYVKNGKVYAEDHFGTSPVKHEPDEKLGGRQDLTNVFGIESNGITEVGFTIPLKSGDSADTPLDPEHEIVLLLAYNSGIDDFRAKHNYRKAYRVNLATGAVKPMTP